jgi:hypothetical protein
MDSMENSNLAVLVMLCFIIIDGVIFAVRVRKARITHDREAALARLNSYPANDFKRR